MYPYHESLIEGTGRLNLDAAAVPGYEDPNAVIIGGVTHIVYPDLLPDDFIPFLEATAAERWARADSRRTRQSALSGAYRLQLSLGRTTRAREARQRLTDEFDVAPFTRTDLWDAMWEADDLRNVETRERWIEARLGALDGEDLGIEGARDLLSIEVWRYLRDPQYADTVAAGRLRAAMATLDHPLTMAVESYALMVESWSQVRLGHSAAAASLDRLEAILEQRPESSIDRILLPIARTFEEHGDYDRALLMHERRGFSQPGGNPHALAFWAEEGRIAEKAGDVERAIRAYSRYLKVRQDPDPELLPEVEAIRAELARLQGG